MRSSSRREASPSDSCTVPSAAGKRSGMLCDAGGNQVIHLAGAHDAFGSSVYETRRQRGLLDAVAIHVGHTPGVVFGDGIFGRTEIGEILLRGIEVLVNVKQFVLLLPDIPPRDDLLGSPGSNHLPSFFQALVYVSFGVGGDAAGDVVALACGEDRLKSFFYVRRILRHA